MVVWKSGHQTDDDLYAIFHGTVSELTTAVTNMSRTEPPGRGATSAKIRITLKIVYSLKCNSVKVFFSAKLETFDFAKFRIIKNCVLKRGLLFGLRS